MRVQCNDAGVLEASRAVKDGGIVIYPTDTTYGIGCNPYQNDAVQEIYRIKSRDASVPLPVLVHSVDAAKKIAHIDQKTGEIIARFWPGALTVIVRVADQLLKESLSLGDKIGIRIPGNACALKLLEKVGYLVGTSANISGREPFTDPAECDPQLEYDVFIDGGVIRGRGESTIIEVMDGQVKFHRLGAISREDVLGA